MEKRKICVEEWILEKEEKEQKVDNRTLETNIQRMDLGQGLLEIKLS